MIPAPLLEGRLEWPRDQWQRGGPWRLGHGLTVVGPGWHPLVRAVFAAVAEVPGAEVWNVRQKCGLLEIRIDHPDEAHREALRALAAACTEASRSLCEGCGTALPAVPPGAAVWRNHCAECKVLIRAGGDVATKKSWYSQTESLGIPAGVRSKKS
jgi:hypothetical protein